MTVNTNNAHIFARCFTCGSTDPEDRKLSEPGGIVCPDDWHPANRPQKLNAVPGWGISAEDPEQFRTNTRLECLHAALSYTDQTWARRAEALDTEVVIEYAMAFERWVTDAPGPHDTWAQNYSDPDDDAPIPSDGGWRDEATGLISGGLVTDTPGGIRRRAQATTIANAPFSEYNSGGMADPTHDLGDILRGGH